MTAPVGLLRQHPKLQLVFSGGEGRLLTTGVTEAALARAFYLEQGVDMSRVQLEGGSRTTQKMPGRWPSCWVIAARSLGCW